MNWKMVICKSGETNNIKSKFIKIQRNNKEKEKMPKQKSSKFNASKSMKEKIKQFKPIKDEVSESEENGKEQEKETIIMQW